MSPSLDGSSSHTGVSASVHVLLAASAVLAAYAATLLSPVIDAEVSRSRNLPARFGGS